MRTSRPEASSRGRFATIASLLRAVPTGRVRTYAISEHSMRPTLDDGDWVIVTTRPHPVRPRDVVVLDHPEVPGLELVKRVSSVGADGVLVLGDDPTAGSVDSVSFGPVPPESITARVLVRYRPLPPRLIR